MTTEKEIGRFAPTESGLRSEWRGAAGEACRAPFRQGRNLRSAALGRRGSARNSWKNSFGWRAGRIRPPVDILHANH